jgi:cytochrome P450
MPAGLNDRSYERVTEVTYLDDIIKETLRLRPAVLTGWFRVTPSEGIRVDEVYIPGDVSVPFPT